MALWSLKVGVVALLVCISVSKKAVLSKTPPFGIFAMAVRQMMLFKIAYQLIGVFLQLKMQMNPKCALPQEDAQWQLFRVPCLSAKEQMTVGPS